MNGRNHKALFFVLTLFTKVLHFDGSDPYGLLANVTSVKKTASIPRFPSWLMSVTLGVAGPLYKMTACLDAGVLLPMVSLEVLRKVKGGGC